MTPNQIEKIRISSNAH